MQDRIPVNPGRVLITPENGSASYYATMTRADNPTQEGTPLNKASLLKDATAALFGLGADAVPDFVFSFIGKYNQHWWSRRTTSGWIETKGDEVSGYLFKMGDSSASLEYAETISISNTGAIDLVNPSTVDSSSYNGSLLLKNKYFRVISGGSLSLGIIYYATGNIGGSYLITARPVTATKGNTEGEWGFIQSSARDAYPYNGVSNGYEYQYLGIPFENAVTAPAIATGSYTGTGTYGASNPNSLTFDFLPKIIFIYGHWGSGGNGGKTTTILIPSVGDYGGSQRDYDYVGKIIVSGNTVSWYATSGTFGGQGNKSGTVYTYIAIG